MARKKRVDELVPLTLRLPEGLRAQLEAEADKAERSLNSEILWRLGQTFGEQWLRFIAGVEEREKEVQELRERLMESPALEKIVSDLIAKHSAKGR